MHPNRSSILCNRTSKILTSVAALCYALTFNFANAFVGKGISTLQQRPISSTGHIVLLNLRRQYNFVLLSRQYTSSNTSLNQSSNNSNSDSSSSNNNNNSIMAENCDIAVTTDDPLSALNLPSPLILGSGSFTRKLILKEMNIPFILKVKPINEYEIGTREDQSYAKDLVMTLAKAKADALIQGLVETNSNHDDDHDQEDIQDDNFNLKLPNYTPTQEYLVLTADQVVTCNNQILEKPTSIEEAHTFIEQYANHPPQTVGSVVITHLPSGKQVSDIDISTINFKATIKDDCKNLVDRLLGDDAPILSCAGGLMVEHPFVKEYILNIDGSEDGVMGLSKALVVGLLKKLKQELDAE